MERQTVRLVVELEPGEPVCGKAGVEGESLIGFEGMLGFLALFDQLRIRAGPPAGTDEPAP